MSLYIYIFCSILIHNIQVYRISYSLQYLQNYLIYGIYQIKCRKIIKRTAIYSNYNIFTGSYITYQFELSNRIMNGNIPHRICYTDEMAIFGYVFYSVSQKIPIYFVVCSTIYHIWKVQLSFKKYLCIFRKCKDHFMRTKHHM